MLKKEKFKSAPGNRTKNPSQFQDRTAFKLDPVQLPFLMRLGMFMII